MEYLVYLVVALVGGALGFSYEKWRVKKAAAAAPAKRKYVRKAAKPGLNAKASNPVRVVPNASTVSASKPSAVAPSVGVTTDTP